MTLLLDLSVLKSEEFVQIRAELEQFGAEESGEGSVQTGGAGSTGEHRHKKGGGAAPCSGTHHRQWRPVRGRLDLQKQARRKRHQY